MRVRLWVHFAENATNVFSPVRRLIIFPVAESTRVIPPILFNGLLSSIGTTMSPNRFDDRAVTAPDKVKTIPLAAKAAFDQKLAPTATVDNIITIFHYKFPPGL